MALRSNPAMIYAILDTQLDVMPFLRTASLLVETHLGTAGLAEPLLQEIETWLAAYLVTQREPRFTQISTDGQSMTFTKQDYLGMVRLLDPTGILAEVLTPVKRATIQVF